MQEIKENNICLAICLKTLHTDPFLQAPVLYLMLSVMLSLMKAPG